MIMDNNNEDDTQSYWLATTLSMMSKSRLTTAQIAEAASVGYHWLAKMKQGEIRNPGIVKVERVYSALLAASEDDI